MRKFITIAIIALTAALGTGAADAQVRIKAFGNPAIMKPKIPRVRPVKPKMLLMPPSQALRGAMKLVPNAKALKVARNGQNYIVSLKSGGTIKRVTVNSATGAATVLP